MIRNATSSFVFLLPLLLLGLFLSGCGRSEIPTTPPLVTETPPELAPGTTAIIDICDQDPMHPDCIPAETQDQFNVWDWQTFTDPENRFEFDYPNGWYTMTMTPDPSDGIRIMDAPSLEEATRWVSLQVFQNPNQDSLQAWIAGHGQKWIGDVIEEQEDQVNGVPVLRQRLKNDDPNTGGPYIYALLWYPYKDLVLCWTSWPGEITEMINLLEQMVSNFNNP